MEPDEEVDDWEDDVHVDPVWNEHNDVEYPSEEPDQSKHDWPEHISPDEVWNEHNQPDDELDDWNGDLPEDSNDEHLEPEHKSEEKCEHQVWDLNNEVNDLEYPNKDQDDWINDEIPEEVSDHDLDLEENVKDPEEDEFDGNSNQNKKSHDPSENEFHPSWEEVECFVKFINNSSFDGWAVWGESEGNFPGSSFHLKWVQWSVIDENTLKGKDVCSVESVNWFPSVDQVSPHPLISPWDQSVEFISWCVF